MRARGRPRGQPFDDGEGAQPEAVLDFIPVELVDPGVISSAPLPAAGDAAEPATQPPLAHLAADADDNWAERTSLFGELEA